MGTLLGAAQLILYFCYYDGSTAKNKGALELPKDGDSSAV
jgi:hypothetical protein